MKMNFGKKGYALLFALVVVSILLVVALAVSRISFQELRISDTAQDSQRALNATNSGAECAMFWDRRESSIFGIEGQIECSGGLASDIYEVGTNIYFFVADFGDGQCAHVTVDKSGMLENRTVIESRGYNICPDGDERNPRRVERAVLVEYEFGGGDDDTLVADISIVVETSGDLSGGGTPSRMDFLQDGLERFVNELNGMILAGGVQVGLTEFKTNGRVLSELTNDTGALLGKIEDIKPSQSQNLAGGIFLGTDVITGNPVSLRQNDNQSIEGGRDLEEGQKFLLIVTATLGNQTAITSGVDRGRQGNIPEYDAEGQAAEAVRQAIEKGIVVLTFNVGVSPSEDQEQISQDYASGPDQWDRCALFDYGRCYFQIESFEDFRDVFNLQTIFGGGYIHWQPL